MSGSHNAHAKISPSGLDRTTVCTASTAFIDELIEKGEIPEYSPMNKFGASGTFAHDLAEEAILHLLDKKESKEIKEAKSLHHWLESKKFYWTDEKTGKKELFQDGYGDLESYIDYCIGQIKDDRDIAYVEVRSKLFYSDNPKDKGTCDFLILHYDGSITIVDLKWRRSGMVESFQNKQLSAYSLSYIENKMLRQPKANTKIRLATYNPLVAPYVEPWDLSLGELKAFCHEEIQVPVDIIKSGVGTSFVPTQKGCQWCPAREKCGAKTLKVAMSFPNSEIVTDEDYFEIFKNSGEIKALLEDAEKRMYDLADKGQAHQGTMMTTGRSNRRYGDPETAGIFLEEHLDYEEIYDPPKIKSFSKITPKLTPEIKKQFEKDHLIKPQGKLKIVLADGVKSTSVTSLKSKLLKSANK